MGRIVPPFRQLSDLESELRAALVDLGHKSAFDVLLKEAWNPEQDAMGNSTIYGCRVGLSHIGGILFGVLQFGDCESFLLKGF